MQLYRQLNIYLFISLLPIGVFGQTRWSESQLKISTLSIVLENNFFNGFVPDSCYTGFHLLTIDIRRIQGNPDLTVTGGLGTYYKTRLETLLKKYIEVLRKEKVWKKNHLNLVLPILFDINTTCLNRIPYSKSMNADSLLKRSDEISNLREALNHVVDQKTKIIETYKRSQSKATTRCLILRPCFITYNSKFIKIRA